MWHSPHYQWCLWDVLPKHLVVTSRAQPGFSVCEPYASELQPKRECPWGISQALPQVKVLSSAVSSASDTNCLKVLKRIFSQFLFILASRGLWFSWLLEDETGHRKGQQIVPPHAQINPRQQWASISMNWPIFVIEVSYWHRVCMAGAMGSASGACHQAAGAEHYVHTLWIRAWFNTAWIGRLQKSHFQNT